MSYGSMGSLPVSVTPVGASKSMHLRMSFPRTNDFRLYATSSVRGRLEILVLPESSITSGQAGSLSRFVVRQRTGNRAFSALASQQLQRDNDHLVEIGHGGPGMSLRSGGLAILLSPVLALCLRGSPTPFAAGRGLHLIFDLKDGPFHVLALYGVSSPFRGASSNKGRSRN